METTVHEKSIVIPEANKKGNKSESRALKDNIN